MSFDEHIHKIYVMGSLVRFERVMNNYFPVYGFTNDTLMRRVEQLQNFHAKISFGGSKCSDHGAPFIEQLEYLEMDKRVIIAVAIHVH